MAQEGFYNDFAWIENTYAGLIHALTPYILHERGVSAF